MAKKKVNPRHKRNKEALHKGLESLKQPPTSSKKQKRLALFVVLVLTLICFIPSINNEFTNWDDDLYVTNNPFLTELSVENLKNIFTKDVSANYNPLTILTYAIERHFFDLNPTPYHVNNLILHLINTALVFWLVLLLGLRLEAVFLVALLFGIHPMRVESVAWVTERKDVLFALFFLGSLISYIFYYKKQRWKFYFLSLFLFVGALLSKIQAVSLPLAMLCIDYYFQRVGKLPPIIEKIPFFALSLLTGIVGIVFLSQKEIIDVTAEFAFYERLLFGAYSFLVYLLKWVFPYSLSTYYPYPEKVGSMLPFAYYLSPIVVGLLVFGLYKTLKYTRAIVFGVLFFLFNIMFVLQIIGAGEAFLADRFTYIPYIGLFFIMGWGFEKLLEERPQWKTALYAGTAMYLLILGGISFQQCKVWENSETLWTNVIEKYDDVPVAYNNRGNFYRTVKKNKLALADFNKAIELNPAYHLAYTNRGNIYFDNNANDQAFADYTKVLELQPDQHKALNNRGSIYFRKGKYAEAEADYNKAIEIDPFYADAYVNRAVVYSVSKRHDLAKKDYDTYIKFTGGNPKVIAWRGIAHRHLKMFDAAIADFNHAIKAQPKNGDNYLNRSYTYLDMGNKAQALQDAQKAQQLGAKVPPEYVQSLY